MRLSDALRQIMIHPAPARAFIRFVIRKLRLGSYDFRFRIGALDKMSYAFIVYRAAQQAHWLGLERVSVLEFGVAGGSGLVWMERHAAEVEKIFPVRIEVYGFDTGEGLPPPEDYRDLPYHWEAGFFKMNVPALEAKLNRSKLVLGPVSETVSTFFEKHDPAPVGAVSHDMDFYSSTRDGFRLFNEVADRFLPRVFCYFDDVIGDEVELYSDYTGERLAIEEFNSDHADRKIAVPHFLRGIWAFGPWQFQIWIFHLFQHPNYNKFISPNEQQLPLSA